MGANAQTTVQKFLSGAVLTAEQQNFSAATGVPVFATTVTRDAAFGGANKVLAEGQLCYLESTDATQYYSGSAWLAVGASPTTAIFNETQASGTYGGTNATATWTKRTLNTTVVNGITSCTLTASVIALPAGTYQIKVDTIAGSGNVQSTAGYRHRLRNTTANTTTALSQSGYNGQANNTNMPAQIITEFTIAVTSNFEVQYYITQSVTSVGLGRSSAIATIDEIYTQIEIAKVA